MLRSYFCFQRNTMLWFSLLSLLFCLQMQQLSSTTRSLLHVSNCNLAFSCPQLLLSVFQQFSSCPAVAARVPVCSISLSSGPVPQRHRPSLPPATAVAPARVSGGCNLHPCTRWQELFSYPTCVSVCRISLSFCPVVQQHQLLLSPAAAVAFARVSASLTSFLWFF